MSTATAEMPVGRLEFSPARIGSDRTPPPERAAALTQAAAIQHFTELFFPVSKRYRVQEPGRSGWLHVDTGKPEWWMCLPRFACFPLGRLIQSHLRQQLSLASFGSWQTCWRLIDLDLHRGDPHVYLEQAGVLIRRFRGRGWHYDVGPIGLHLIQAFATHGWAYNPHTDLYEPQPWQPVRLEQTREGLRRVLRGLAEQNPDLEDRARKAGMKGLADLEVYPDVKQPVRVPLGEGRWLWTDDLMYLRQNRAGHWVADVQGYVQWLLDPDRKYAQPEEVLGFLHDVTQTRSGARTTSPRACDGDPASGQEPASNRPGGSVPVPAQKSLSTHPGEGEPLGKMRGRFGPTLANLRLGLLPPEDHVLATVIRMWLRLLFVAGYGQDEAVTAIGRELLKVENTAFSTCLDTGNWKAIQHKVGYQARAIWRAANRNQSRSDESTGKLREVAEYWQRIGLDLTNLDDFVRHYGPGHEARGEGVQCAVIHVSGFAPPLTPEEEGKVAQFAGSMKVDVAEAKRLLVSLLLHLRAGRNEMCLRNLPRLLSNFQIKLADHTKQTRFKRLLLELGFLAVAARHWAGHRGTAYQPGPAGRALLDRLPELPEPDPDEFDREDLEFTPLANEER